MIDTIRVKFPITPSEKQLQSWDRQRTVKSSGEIRERFMYNAYIEDYQLSIRCTYLPQDYTGQPMLSIEFSLPKAVFGNNFTMIRDLPQAIEHANQLLATLDALPTLDLGEGVLLRLDPCYNHQVGDLVPDYINAIGKLEYPHRRTKHHRDEGAEFRSKNTITKFYDKQREAKDINATGILRQETTYNKAKRIAELMGTKQPTLRNVTSLRIVELLRDDLAKLRLDDRIIADHETALAKLSEKHGPHAGLFHFGLLTAKLEKSKKQLAAQSKNHPRSIDRRIKAIVDAGIAPTLTETREPLPPLKIEL